MKVGLDITSLIYNRGVSRYTSNLARALGTHRGLELFLYGSSYRTQKQLIAAASSLLQSQTPEWVRSHLRVQPFPPVVSNILWNKLHLNPIQSHFPSLDVFHSWDWIQPPDKNIPIVSTIHDLAILRHPETAHPHVLAMHRQSWKTLIDRQAQIITISRSTRRDIIELLHIPPERVHIIYEALPQEFVDKVQELTEAELDAIKLRLCLDRPYLLFVGTREPRKNLARLIEAWRPLAKDVDLVIAGERGWDETSQSGQGASARSSGPKPRFLGKVSDKELITLYSEAEALVYPSIAEGFGLPILEAFYFGTPVVTSNTSSMPEVAGNAAELVDPLSVDSIRQGITTILNDDSEAQKKRLQRMIIRRQLFSWDRVADQTIQIYQLARRLK